MMLSTETSEIEYYIPEPPVPVFVYYMQDGAGWLHFLCRVAEL